MRLNKLCLHCACVSGSVFHSAVCHASNTHPDTAALKGQQQAAAGSSVQLAFKS